MAAEEMKKVAGHLTCPVCYELYKKPKCLPCYHSYCEECLVKLQKGGTDITCPECRKTSVVPTGGVKQLPNNFFINRIVDEVALKEKVTGEEEVRCDLCIREDPAIVLCFDCGTFLCDRCHESHKYSKEYQGHNLSQLKELRVEKKEINVRPKAKLLLCQEHEVELNFYCDTCEQLVCHYCTTTDHNGHNHNTVKKMANKHRLEMDKIIEPVDKMINELSKAHHKITATREKIHVQATEVDQQIDDYYDRLQEWLQQQRQELKNEVQEVSTQKKKTVSLQLEQIEHNQAQLVSMKELNDDVKNGSDQEALFMKKQVTEDVKRLTGCFKELKIEPVELATMQFIPVEEYENVFPQFANVFYGEADPLNSVAEDIPPVAYVNKEVKFRVITNNAQGHRCSNGGSKVIAQVQSSSAVVPIPVTIRDDYDGSYSASFLPKQACEVRLLVIINGRCIKGSPYSVSVWRNYLALNMPSKLVNDGGRMGKPWGIAFGKDGMWAVTDNSNHCVYIFDSQDQLVRKFGCRGSGSGRFDNPTGLAFDADDNLYVVCTFNHRVQKLTINGKFLLQFGNRGRGNGQLECPGGVTVHNNRVYVADMNNHRISVFQCDGKFCHNIQQKGQLHQPDNVAVNSDNQLLIADNYCISIFTLDGNYVGKFGTHGTGKGELSHPSSLTFDTHGFVLVTEWGNQCVSIFDKDGVFIHCFGSEGSTNGQFSRPIGIALNPNGTLYVNDHYNKRIQIFCNY